MLYFDAGFWSLAYIIESYMTVFKAKKMRQRADFKHTIHKLFLTILKNNFYYLLNSPTFQNSYS